MVVDNERGDSTQRYPVSLIRDGFSMNILPLPEDGQPIVDVVTGQLTYWKQHLEGAASILELPTDRPYRLVQTFVDARYSFELPPSLAAALRLLRVLAQIT